MVDEPTVNILVFFMNEKKTFGIKEIAKQIVQKNSEFSITMAEKFIKSFLDIIVENLQSAEDRNITFKGFGNFSVITTRARNGRNPFTQEPMHIPAKKRVSFKAAKALLELLNSSK